MGRQIQFHMLQEDQAAFLQYVGRQDPVVVALRDSESAEIEPITNFQFGLVTDLVLWNRDLLPKMERKWIPEPGYFRADVSRLPILEFTTAFKASWEGIPAIGQGRLYGNFESYLNKPATFTHWFDRLARWIRTNYERNPTGLSGYTGPAAYDFYRKGGYLLPNFLPPRTEAWLTEIGKQSEHKSLLHRTPTRKSGKQQRSAGS